jgi:protein translocase SecG subunit
MQHGKGAEAGASFSNVSQTFFGNKGSKSFLVKLTSFVTVLFFINCFIIGLFNNKFQSNGIINILEKEEIVIKDKKEIITNMEDIPIEN